jgi:hypothetical protein
MMHWLRDPDLKSVRDPDGLGRFPEAERRDWEKLWADARALLEPVLAPEAVPPPRVVP